MQRYNIRIDSASVRLLDAKTPEVRDLSRYFMERLAFGRDRGRKSRDFSGAKSG